MSDQPVNQNLREAIGVTAVRAYGQYMLVRKLAEGGMAEIFLAKQVGVEGFEKNVVIKRMLPHLSAVPDFVSMFLDEARLAASLSHPNIVQISDLGFADGCYFICMEYLPGEDFATVLRTSRRRNEHAPLHIVLRVIADAAMGLHFAHQAVDPQGRALHLVHRDVSPSNIFITYDGQVKVLDFGIAKAESRVSTTGAGVVKGKYQYMSPEQARGDVVDLRSDIFSLGVSLYEALSGVRPFARDTDLAVLKAVLEGDYQPIRVLRPDVPLEVEQIVTRAMSQEAEYRYSSGLAMVTDIEKFMGSTTSATGAQALGMFMRGFFGDERVKSKTRIESLTELSGRGVDVPGRANPYSPKTDPGTSSLFGGAQGDGATKAVGLPSDVRRTNRRRGVRVAALLAAAVVLSIGGTLGFLKLTQHPVLPETIDAGIQPTLDAATHQPVVDTALDAGLVVDAGPAVVDAGAPSVDAGAAVVTSRRPVSLTTALVLKTFNQHTARIQKCFRDGADELPTKKGKVKIFFVIASSGRVSEVSTEIAGARVSHCIESVVRSMQFPRHVDAEVRVPLVLDYGVE